MSPEARDLIKKRYFQLWAQERLGHTPDITKELDHIEEVLRCEDLEANSKPPLSLSFGEHDSNTARSVTDSPKPSTNGDGGTPGGCRYGG